MREINLLVLFCYNILEYFRIAYICIYNLSLRYLLYPALGVVWGMKQVNDLERPRPTSGGGSHRSLLHPACALRSRHSAVLSICLVFL